MSNEKGLFNKLLAIQKRIIGLGKDKSTYNYKYVTGDKLLNEIKPMMNDLGILLKQEIISIENTRQDYTLIDKTGKEKHKSEINSKVMLRFTWVDCETGEKDENYFGANGQNDWDKGVGSALTYGERYFLLKYFHIATDEDDIDNPDRKPATAYNHTAIEQDGKKLISNELFREAMLRLDNSQNIEADVKKLKDKYSLEAGQLSLIETKLNSSKILQP